MITGSTKVFGVIADPINHVRAPMVYNPVFKKRGIDAVLVPMHITEDNLEASIRGLAAMPNIGGVCVTIPHKMTMAKLCDELGLTAELTGAVNAVRFENGRIIGDNFDGRGFTAGLIGEGHGLDGKNILMIGAGGAARAIAAAIAEYDISGLTIANRTLEKAEEIVGILTPHNPQKTLSALAMDGLDQVISDHDIIINTTSLGLHDGDDLPCGLDQVKNDALIADIIMIPPVTAWMKEAEKKGLKTHAGKHMLDYQRDLMGEFFGAL